MPVTFHNDTFLVCPGLDSDFHRGADFAHRPLFKQKGTTGSI